MKMSRRLLRALCAGRRRWNLASGLPGSPRFGVFVGAVGPGSISSELRMRLGMLGRGIASSLIEGVRLIATKFDASGIKPLQNSALGNSFIDQAAQACARDFRSAFNRGEVA